jgi:hypothetical protein
MVFERSRRESKGKGIEHVEERQRRHETLGNDDWNCVLNSNFPNFLVT